MAWVAPGIQPGSSHHMEANTKAISKHMLRNWNLFFHMGFSSKLNDVEHDCFSWFCLTFFLTKIRISFFQLIHYSKLEVQALRIVRKCLGTGIV